jgi:hypothetical protein
MNKERRALCRFEPCDLTKTAVNNTKPESAEGVLSNISELGLCLVTDTPFAPGSDVELYINLKHLSVVLQADARIVWTRTERGVKGKSAESFVLGAQFVWMPHPDRRCLKWALSSPEFKKEPSFDTVSTVVIRGAPIGKGQPIPLSRPSPRLGSGRNGNMRRRSFMSVKSNWRELNQTFDGVVLIVREGAGSIERLCRLVKSAGFNPVLTNSPETVASKARVMKPSLVLFSQHIGPPGVSETARRIKDCVGGADTPVAILTEDASKPYLHDSAYPVEACVPLNADAASIVKNIRLLAHKRPQQQTVEKPLGAIEGNIEKNTLSEVLQYLSTAGKTGRMTIRAGRRNGCVYLDGGDLVHAHYGPIVGIEACRAIVCRLQEGYFKFEPNVRPSRTTMRENGLELIIEAAKQMDELTRRSRPVVSEPPEV